MTRHAISPRLATRMVRNGVIPGLVPGIQASAGAGASGTMDPGDKHRDDNVGDGRAWSSSQLLDLLRPRRPALLDEGADALAGVAGQRRGKRVRGRIEHWPQRLTHRGAHQLLRLGNRLR